MSKLLSPIELCMQSEPPALDTGNPHQGTTEAAQPGHTQHEFVASSLLDLTEEQLARILGATASPRTVARASCVCRQLRTAADAAFMYLCESTGRCKPAEVGQSRGGAAATAQGGAVSWQQRFFENTFALHFDGERDFVRLPPTLLSKGISGHGFALDILFLAHLIEPAGQGAPAGGGVLLGMQDREFGRARRAARLRAVPILFLGRDGGLCAYTPDLKLLRSCGRLDDGQWHRVCLNICLYENDEAYNTWEVTLWVDGDCMGRQISCGWGDWGRDACLTLGSGVDDHLATGHCHPQFKCHSLHGCIAELRVWSRALDSKEIQASRWQRVTSHTTPGLHACYSFTEGSGKTLHSHVGRGLTAELECVQPSHYFSRGSQAAPTSLSWLTMENHLGPTWQPSTASVAGALKVDELTSWPNAMP